MKTLKATVPSGSAGLMKGLVLSMFFVSLLSLNSCANLMDAAKKGDTAKVEALLNTGTDVNAKDKDGITALMVASEKGHTEIVKALIDKGADVNAKDKYGWTALMWASENGHTEVVKALLEKVMVKLKAYQVGKLKRSEFRAQWDFTTGGEFGIVGISSYNHVITYYMGFLMLESSGNYSIIFGGVISGRIFHEAIEAQALEGSDVRSWDKSAIIVCQLVFKDEVLYTNDCK